MKKTFKFDSNTWIAIAAIVVSSCALIVSIIQTQIMKDQKAASSWPFVQWVLQRGWNSDSTGIFKLSVYNKGVGPAIIEKVSYKFNEKNYPSYEVSKFIEDMVNLDNGKKFESYNLTTIQGRVLAPNEEITHFEINDSTVAYNLSKKIVENDINIIINYRDVYGNQWQYQRNKNPMDLLKK